MLCAFCISNFIQQQRRKMAFCKMYSIEVFAGPNCVHIMRKMYLSHFDSPNVSEKDSHWVSGATEMNVSAKQAPFTHIGLESAAWEKLNINHSLLGFFVGHINSTVLITWRQRENIVLCTRWTFYICWICLKHSTSAGNRHIHTGLCTSPFETNVL